MREVRCPSRPRSTGTGAGACTCTAHCFGPRRDLVRVDFGELGLVEAYFA